MLKHAHLFYKLVPLGVALLFSTGCKECPECPSQDVAKMMAAPDSMLTERMSRSETERIDMMREFHDHFRLIDSSRIAGTEQEVPWLELKKLVDKVKEEDHPDRGIVFHYGLRDGAFKLGLSAVPLEDGGPPTRFTYDYDEATVYPVAGNEIKFNSGLSYAQWFSTYTHGTPLVTGTYFHATKPSIQVRRTNDEPAAWTPVVHGTDVEHEVMPFERELDRLHRENSPSPEGYDEFVVISCASTYDAALSSYRHRLILHMRYRLHTDQTLYSEALSDRHSPDDDLTPFFKRAADLGNLCPPQGNCGVYVLQHAFQ